MNVIDVVNLEPLLSVAREELEPDLRVSTLDTAARFPLSTDGWRRVADMTWQVIQDEAPGSKTRRSALKLAVHIPLSSLRRQMRAMAEHPKELDRDVIVSSLDEVRDVSRIDALMKKAQSGDGSAFEILAAMPLEEVGISGGDIPEVSEDSSPIALFWRALVLARVGDFGEIEKFLDGSMPEPEYFYGSPWTAYDVIATICPVPTEMHEYLLNAIKRFKDHPTIRMVQLIGWAATGTADAEGCPLSDAVILPEEVPGSEDSPRPTSGQPIVRLNESLKPLSAQRLVEIIVAGNKRAARISVDIPSYIMVGNDLINLISERRVVDDFPVVELTLEHFRAERPVLDDDQMAWVLSQGQTERVIQKMAELLSPTRSDLEHSRILRLLGNVGDHVAGRAGSPYRGAGGGGGVDTRGRGLLIDDEFQAAVIGSDPPQPDPPPHIKPPEQSTEENRFVQAQIWHDGQKRNTFLAGVENIIRCWIGLPQPEEAAVADEPIPPVDIPAEGLDLTVQVIYKDQIYTKPLRLPASRTARSADCDLQITVPEGERYVSADIAFLYRGRIFEMVQVEAFVLKSGEEEQPQHVIQVRAQASRRQVVDLPGREDFDAAMVVSDATSPSDENDSQVNQFLRVFGSHGQGCFDLSDAVIALDRLNKNLFVTAKSLVRKRESSGAVETKPGLDADDPHTLDLLRNMARHGANFFNDLTGQKFKDPGKRIQILNMSAETYVPLEFVYDRGYPADDAILCDGWEEVLLSDVDECPVCSQQVLTDEQRTWTETICPLGFWSLQKIIERLNPETTDAQIAAPSGDRPDLPVISDVLFASSHKVKTKDREKVWKSLTSNFSKPNRADDWQQWKQILNESHPPLLLVIPHHDNEAGLDYLEIGDKGLDHHKSRLSRGQLTNLYVNPQGIEPGPIVLILGCRTGAQTEVGYVHLTRRFQMLHTSIVIGTLAQVLGRHAAPVASEFVTQLVAVNDPKLDFGTIMRRIRRRMLANGHLMSLCLVALGDADWHLTPRQTTNIGGD